MKTFDERRESVQNHMNRIRTRRNRILAASTSLILVVAVVAGAFLLGRDPSGSQQIDFEKNEYGHVIRQLQPAVDRYCGINPDGDISIDPALPPVGSGDVVMDGAPEREEPSDAPLKGDSYQEVTDNQVQGVIEADFLKRSDRYAYYLRKNVLSVYSIAGEDSALVGTYVLPAEQTEAELEDFGTRNYYRNTQLYLSHDCSTVTLVTQAHFAKRGACTILVNLDVTDPANITEKNRIYFRGSYISSRMVDGQFLLAYNSGFPMDQVDFDDPSTFIPQYGRPGDMHCIAGNNIVVPEDSYTARYTVICKVDGASLEVTGTAALLCYAQELYVSQDTVYATYGYSENIPGENKESYTTVTMTRITGIGYGGTELKILGSVDLEGSVRNQYSMDQHNGTLRVVTSTVARPNKNPISGTRRNVNLYCIGLWSWQIKASVLAFAPDGEDAQSVRFDGDYAYVCTAEVVTMTDPVYFFDLSDLDNITWKDTGTIDGYSTSLVNLGEGYLLGIGLDGLGNLKIEVYEETADGVRSVCAYTSPASFSIDYKSYLIDRENDLVGLHIRYYNQWEAGAAYILLHFDGYELREIKLLAPVAGNLADTRAFMQDGYLYLFTSADGEGFYVTKAFD